MNSLVKKVFLTLTDTMVGTKYHGIWAFLEMETSGKQMNNPTKQTSVPWGCPANPAVSEGC